ncbi:MAG TPA: hypothetical protein VLT82_16045 [Myxococcaceae bacterium]|nr:hypothetical protein [Myxococcaceae bacterium]
MSGATLSFALFWTLVGTGTLALVVARLVSRGAGRIGPEKRPPAV